MLLHDAAAVFKQCENNYSIAFAFGGTRHAEVCRTAHAGVRQRCSTAKLDRSGQHPAVIMSESRAALPITASPSAADGTPSAAPRHALAPGAAADLPAAGADIVGTGTDATSKTANASVDAQPACEEDTAASSPQVGSQCKLQVHACMAHASDHCAVLTCRCETCCRTTKTLTATTTCSLPSCSACSYRFPHHGCDALPPSIHRHWFGALGLRC